MPVLLLLPCRMLLVPLLPCRMLSVLLLLALALPRIMGAGMPPPSD